MASGSSVIGICKDENELRDVVEAADCGTCIPAENLISWQTKLNT